VALVVWAEGDVLQGGGAPPHPRRLGAEARRTLDAQTRSGASWRSTPVCSPKQMRGMPRLCTAGRLRVRASATFYACGGYLSRVEGITHAQRERRQAPAPLGTKKKACLLYKTGVF
jgi:hypothetical protein